MAKLLISTGSLPASEVDVVYKKFKAFFETELAKHFLEEERFLVPPLRDNDLIKRMCEEHGVMKKMFILVDSSKNLSAALEAIGEYLGGHIRFEERELFPMIESALSEETLLEISSKVRAVRRTG